MLRPHPRRGGRRAALTATALCLLLGPAVGIAWWIIAPTPEVIMGDGSVFLANPETSAFIAADGWFAVLGTVAGFLSAAVVFRRHQGVAALLGLTVGAVLASLVAWRVGHLLGPSDLPARARSVADGSTLPGPLDLRAFGVLLAWPIAAVSAFLSFTVGFTPRRSNGAHDRENAPPLKVSRNPTARSRPTSTNRAGEGGLGE